MQVLLVEQLKPGFVVARDLVDAMGRVLLVRGVRLTERYIAALREKGYTRLYVRTSDEPEVDGEEDISPMVRCRAKEMLRETFDQIEAELMSLKAKSQDEIVRALQSNHVRALMNQKAMLASISKLTAELLDEVLTRRTLAGLTSLKGRDGALYDHSLDVCAVAIMIGAAANLPTARLRQLAAGCLLHDIGMMFFDRNDDEAKRIRRHTTLGYELLKATEDPDLLSPYVAYEHHEHQDGSGLPRGLKSSNKIERQRGTTGPVLTLIGEIAAVANHYDNLLSGVNDREPIPPDEALKEISALAGTWFNREVVSVLRRVAPVYPQGTQVVMRGEPLDHYVGLVSRINADQLDRPWVVLVKNGLSKKVEPTEVDMRSYPQVSLKSVGI